MRTAITDNLLLLAVSIVAVVLCAVFFTVNRSVAAQMGQFLGGWAVLLSLTLLAINYQLLQKQLRHMQSQSRQERVASYLERALSASERFESLPKSKLRSAGKPLVLQHLVWLHLLRAEIAGANDAGFEVSKLFECAKSPRIATSPSGVYTEFALHEYLPEHLAAIWHYAYEN